MLRHVLQVLAVSAVLASTAAFACDGNCMTAASAQSDKCGCSSAADCTCKKGQCKCPKCGKRSSLYEPMKGQSGKLELPKTRDARAGVFI